MEKKIEITEKNEVIVGKQKYLVPEDDLFYAPFGTSRYNKKTKVYPGGYTKEIYCSSFAFQVRVPKEKEGAGRKRVPFNYEKFFVGSPEFLERINWQKKKENDRRAVAHIEDIAFLNPDMNLFVTLTFDINGVFTEAFDSTNPELVEAKVKTFLTHAVSRKGLKYVLVPEFHEKDNKIHFHGLFNEALELADSGTRKVAGFEKPVSLKKIDKWLRKGRITEEDVLEVVYNISSWTFGFSTAVKLEKNQASVVAYITKYILKDVQGKNKIFGKRYWSSRNIDTLPVIKLENSDVDFDKLPMKKYHCEFDNREYKYKNNIVNRKE